MLDLYLTTERCNLCGWPLLRINRSAFGLRCVRCRSTHIHRALGAVAEHLTLSPDQHVYELSTHGAWHRYVRARFPRATFSDYDPAVPSGRRIGGVLFQQVETLSFPSAAFDVVSSTEVFEHVADDLAGFRQIHRVLRPGGFHIFTVPYDPDAPTRERAKLSATGQRIEHLPAEYHRNHRGQAVFTYRNYGNDLSRRQLECGFASAVTYRVHTQRSIPAYVQLARKRYA